MKLTAHYTSFAEYMSACDSDSSKRIAHYEAQLQQAAEEARIQRHAAMWQRLAAMTLDEVRICAIRAPGMAAFLNTFES